MKVSVVIPNYNCSSVVVRCARAFLEQESPNGAELRIVVVDDGSLDDSVVELRKQLGNRIDLVTLPANRGRCTARNEGALGSDADFVIFVDSDCIPTSTDFVASHVQALSSGADVSFGEVVTPGSGFWDRLQTDGNSWRRRRFREGDTWTFTTQNVAIRRESFAAIGGFDQAFERHGFEDRDLFVRLAKAGARAVHTEAAKVRHEDKISLASVARKLGEAGELAAPEFSMRHPEVYRRMAFSRLDCRLHPAMAILDRTLWPLARLAIARGESWLEWPWLPFRFRAFLARSLYGLSFLHGTAVRSRSKDERLTG